MWLGNLQLQPSRDLSRPAVTPSAERLHLVVTGHVDHGKSTIVGRLLADTGSLPQGKLAAVCATCQRHAKPFEYAFLLDALRDEQAQGITIDSARVFFATRRRHYVVVDAPGHVEFLKNMITGASRAEAALLVIDANEGVRENSRRHGFMLSMLGIRQIAVLVNKMDLVGYRADVFESVVAEYGDFLGRLGVTPDCFIPVSGFNGENLTRPSPRLGWHRGPTVLEALEGFSTRPHPAAAAFRMPVQGVYKFTNGGDDRRIVAGTIEGGRIMEGDEVVFHPSGKKSRVKRLERFSGAPRSEAGAGEAVGFTLAEQIYVGRGEIAVKAVQPKPHVGTRFKVSLFWLGRQPLVTGRQYLFKLGSARVACEIAQIHRVIDASDLDAAHARARIERHEVAECTIELQKPVAFDTVDQSAATSRFVLVDNFEISGGGIIREALAEGHTTSPATPTTTTAPAVVWFTGLSGAGKSTIAREVCERLKRTGVKVEYLDGDIIRNILPTTGFSRRDRDEHVKRVGFLASRLEHHGVVVVCALISPYAESRACVRELCQRFIEIYVATPLEECERRDVKGLYQRARRGEIANFTGIDDAYEPPEDPELCLDTSNMNVEQAVELVLRALPTEHAADRDDDFACDGAFQEV